MTQAAEDPVVTSSRREAAIAIILWAVAMTYTVGYCYRYGYGRAPEDVRLILGIPDWVLWGIFVPWVAWTVISSLFAKFVMRDAQMDEDETSDDVAAGPSAPAAEASHG